MNDASKNQHPRRTYEKLRDSEFFATYQDAFRTATGLPLRLVSAQMDDWCLDGNTENRSPFCQELNLCHEVCRECLETNRRLMAHAVVNGPTTCQCFAGMSATAVPVEAEGEIVGFLKTGQVFTRVPEPAAFERVARILARNGMSEDAILTFHTAYQQTRRIEPQRYQSMVTLLATFARQLGEHAEKIVAFSQGREPAGVTRAREYIAKNLGEPLPLAAVARIAGLSESHFCRIFRDAVGMTLTDYINRCRIEWAKRELLAPDARVSEIAFHVGYQSLSQFNRCFARLTGRSPSQYRGEELARLAV